MRILTAIALFVGVALFNAASLWPPQAPFVQSFPTDVIALTALWTPLLATWLMPTRRSLLIYPAAVIGLWIAAGYVGEHFIPRASPEQYVCGLPFLAIFIGGAGGITLGVTGRALGLAVSGRLKSGIAIYFVQLIPIGIVLFLFAIPR